MAFMPLDFFALFLVSRFVSVFNTQQLVSVGLQWKIVCVQKSSPAAYGAVYVSGCTCIQRFGYSLSFCLVFSLDINYSLNYITMQSVSQDFLRQNNTGKLLWQVFGVQSATLCLFGIPEDETIMWDAFKSSGFSLSCNN